MDDNNSRHWHWPKPTQTRRASSVRILSHVCFSAWHRNPSQYHSSISAFVIDEAWATIHGEWTSSSIFVKYLQLGHYLPQTGCSSTDSTRSLSSHHLWHLHTIPFNVHAHLYATSTTPKAWTSQRQQGERPAPAVLDAALYFRRHWLTSPTNCLPSSTLAESIQTHAWQQEWDIYASHHNHHYPSWATQEDEHLPPF